MSFPISAATLRTWVSDARRRTLEIVADLSDEELMGPKLDIVNPLLWEIGHVAWFQEKWALRHALDRMPLRDDADALWDSMAIAHDIRWDLHLPTRGATVQYMEDVRDGVLDALDKGNGSDAVLYHAAYSVFHEDMHTEAFTYTRQTRGLPRPRISNGESVDTPQLNAGPLRGDVVISGQTFMLGASPRAPFVLDNEKWEHPVELEPYAMARGAVTQADFQAFVDDQGYERRDLWCEDGWSWRESQAAQHPLYWERDATGRWYRRHFDVTVPLEPHRPVIHVNWYEAEAYCRWAGRRLPSEAEWEAAAAGTTGRQASGSHKRTYPWGDDPPSIQNANLDWRGMGCADVAAFPDGDSAAGCRQMIGNVWEWTSSDFQPYPGFVPDPYRDYSEPWFGTRKVLRGGCWATRGRLLRNTWRNFYTPDRRDVFAGFRTCARS